MKTKAPILAIVSLACATQALAGTGTLTNWRTTPQGATKITIATNGTTSTVSMAAAGPFYAQVITTPPAYPVGEYVYTMTMTLQNNTASSWVITDSGSYSPSMVGLNGVIRMHNQGSVSTGLIAPGQTLVLVNTWTGSFEGVAGSQPPAVGFTLHSNPTSGNIVISNASLSWAPRQAQNLRIENDGVQTVKLSWPATQEIVHIEKAPSPNGAFDQIWAGLGNGDGLLAWTRVASDASQAYFRGWVQAPEATLAAN